MLVRCVGRLLVRVREQAPRAGNPSEDQRPKAGNLTDKSDGSAQLMWIPDTTWGSGGFSATGAHGGWLVSPVSGAQWAVWFQAKFNRGLIRQRMCDTELEAKKYAQDVEDNR